MASTHIDLNVKKDQSSIEVTQTANDSRQYIENNAALQCILEELKRITLHLSFITEEEVE